MADAKTTPHKRPQRRTLAPLHQHLDLCLDALSSVWGMHDPVDMAMHRFFQNHRSMGANDRHWVAETVYAILRHRESLQHWLKSWPDERWVLLVWRDVLQLNLDDFKDMPQRILTLWPTLPKLAYPGRPARVEAELPEWLWDEMLQHRDEATCLAIGRAMQSPAPLDLRVNTLKTNRETMLKQFNEAGFATQATPFSSQGLRLLTKPAIHQQDWFKNGEVEVQDEGSQLVSSLLAPRRGEMVVDFCAGAGGKTLHLGAMMQSTGRLYAMDVSEYRLRQLKPRLQRSGLSNVHPVLLAHERDERVKRLAGKIDRVLVDAPCSGSGTLRRNPDLKWRQSAEGLLELNAKQNAILAAAASLPRPGGRLVYATCSLLPRENQQVVEAFLANHPDYRLLDVRQMDLAPALVASLTGPYLEVQPHDHGCDGFFAAVLERIKPERAEAAASTEA